LADIRRELQKKNFFVCFVVEFGGDLFKPRLLDRWKTTRDFSRKLLKVLLL